MTTPDTGCEQVELATGNDIAAYFDRANDQAAVFAFLPEEDDTIGAAITLAQTTVKRARALIQAFKDLEANAVTTSPGDDQIIVAVRRGPDETARWRLQPEEAGWQIAQIAEDLEDHLVSLVEADEQERNNQ